MDERAVTSEARHGSSRLAASPPSRVDSQRCPRQKEGAGRITETSEEAAISRPISEGHAKLSAKHNPGLIAGGGALNSC